MPAISKIRFTNVVYEDGQKRYNDDTFYFEGENGAIVLENGGGKTVFIQTALQAILPHTDVAGRKIKDTLSFAEGPAHIGIEWILSERPRRYALTAVTLFQGRDHLESYRFVDEYREGDKHGLTHLPFVRDGGKRPAERGEMLDYYRSRTQESGRLFDTISGFKDYIETNYHIISNEWESIVKINSSEGDIERFFEKCQTSRQLFERLLIPAVESTLVSNDEQTFVETFSGQRQAFKEYERFQETVRENRLIEEKLRDYVEQFARADEEEKRYEAEKRYAKAITHYYKQALEKKEKEKKEIEQAFAELASLQNEHMKKKLSYDIALKRERLQEVEETWRTSELELRACEGEIAKLERQYGSLKAAELRENIERIEGELSHLQKELERHDESFDLDELTDELDKNTRLLKGYFITLEEKLEKKERELKREMELSKEQLEEEETQLEELNENRHASMMDCRLIESKVQSLEKQMATIEKELLANRAQESITDLVRTWMREMTALDENIVRLKTENNELRVTIEKLGEKREELFKERENARLHLAKLEQEEKQIDDEHEQLKADVQLLMPNFSIAGHLYRVEETLLGNVFNEMSQLEEKRTQLLQKERIAYRYVDDYAEMSLFFVDRFMHIQVQRWKNQFSYLATGTEFLQQLSLETTPTYYPYWAITLITTKAEKETLLQRVSQEADELQYPIIVLSNDEAHALLKEEEWTSFTQVTPSHWHDNLDEVKFTTWKEQLEQQAELIKHEREEIEGTLKHWQLIEQRLKDFFHQYPYEVYTEIKNEINDTKHQIEMLTRQIERTEEQEKGKKEQLRQQEKQVHEDGELLQEIGRRLEKGQYYVQLEKEHEKEKQALAEAEVKLAEIERQREWQKRAVKRAEEMFDERKQTVQDHHYEKLRKTVHDALYEETKEVTDPLFQEVSYYELKAKRDSLRRDLDKISYGRRVIEKNIKLKKEELHKTTDELRAVKEKYRDLDMTLTFPLDGKEKLITLERERKKREYERKQFAEVEKDANRRVIREQTIVEQAEEGFLKHFPDEQYITFNLPLVAVKEALTSEKKKIEIREEQLHNRQQHHRREHEKLQKICQAFKVLDGRHQFLAPDIEADPLSEEIRTELLYQAETFFQKVQKQLDDLFKEVDTLRQHVQRTKVAFQNFCYREIKNSKLRDRTLQGLEHHTTFERLLQFQAKMDETTSQAIQFAEKSMKDTDKDLEQFIHRMYTHIETIVSELKTIPQKTRVYVDDQWKTIYQFSIPEWEENEAKIALRHYLQTLVNRLESERFKDVSGREDTAKVRNEIEEALHSRQLLNIMTNHQKMSVQCRKVTNDNSVTSRYYVWETTNNWSGGEKWSKNMTLFLGLLNYIAEKRQDIRPHRKRHRTVIVDNPFGKASSDHVLQPVFFIAEQLGFQIIALTAHVEGKFLRDYFPVIYSCRLRQAANSSKQIVEKEKQISYAYFQDHHPDALERLGEQEQLELL